MKRLFTIFATFAMLCAVGCEEQGGDDVNPNDKPNTEEPSDKPNDGGGNENGNPDEGGNENEQPDENLPEEILFALNKTNITISPDGGSVDVTVYSNYKWEIEGGADWCTPSVTSGEANENGQTITFSAELTYDTRETVFWFTCANEKTTLIVSQSLKDVIIPDENNTFNIPAEGGVAVLNYETTVECEVVIPEEAQSWLTIATADATRGLVAESVTLDIATNTTYRARSAVVKVVKKGDNSLYAEYTINQEQNDALIADKTSINVGGWAQSVALKYKTNIDCEVIIPEEAKEWVSLYSATRALVQESATLNIADNNTGAERSAVVQVVAVNNQELIAEYTITQAQRYIIQYTSTDGKVVRPDTNNAFGANVGTNRYENGVGTIDFDAPITSIGDYSFLSCKTLLSINIPTSVTSIGVAAFYQCFNLKNVSIPNSVTIISNEAFSNCQNLVSVNIPDGVTEIGDDAFSGCTSLTSVNIPDSITEIKDGAFAYCSSIESIVIPDRVSSIGALSFHSCDNLTDISIPEGLIQIGNSAFACCTSLVDIVIPSSVVTIGCYAFAGCNNLDKVYCKPTTPPHVDGWEWFAFDNNASGRKIYVPRGSGISYQKARGWWDYANDIVAYDF